MLEPPRKPGRFSSICVVSVLMALNTALWANLAVEGTAEKLRFSVPYGLRPPAAPHLVR